MRSRIFLFSFILSLPLWLGINALTGNLENFFFSQEIAGNPQIFTAAVINPQVILEKKDNLDINAQAVLSVVIDKTGNEKVLFEKNSNLPQPIASLTKLMTALVVLDLKETYNLDQTIKITKAAVEQEGASKYGNIKEGQNLSIRTLLNVVLVESNNDAAYALSELISPEAFIDLMNFYAKDMGLVNTKFFNPTGLDPNDSLEPKNYSTPRDFVELSKYILKNYPQIFTITTQNSYKVLNPDGSLNYVIPQNTNELLTKSKRIIGGKTGWTESANGCLLLVLKNPYQKNNYFIDVILGSDDRFGEMEKIIKEVNKISN